MKHNTQELAYLELQKLGLPPIFDQIWTSQTPRRFCQQWTLPRMYFIKYEDILSLCPKASESVPLLESNLGESLLFDLSKAQYIHYHHGDEDVTYVGGSYQQLITYMFVDLGDAGLFDLVEEMASDFGYKHLAELSAFLEEDHTLSPLAEKAKFVQSIRD